MVAGKAGKGSAASWWRFEEYFNSRKMFAPPSKWLPVKPVKDRPLHGGRLKDEIHKSIKEGWAGSPFPLLARHMKMEALVEAGHQRDIVQSLPTNVDEGLIPEEIVERKQRYEGEDVYPHKPARSFMSFLGEAFHNRHLLFMLVCAALSLTFQIKTDSVEDGWYRGTTIILQVCMVIVVTAVSNYKLHGLQSQAFIHQKNIKVKVNRGGRNMRISIYELVVGDIVHFNTGDQIPADGCLIDGHSINIRYSGITGTTEFSQVNAVHPFLQSGCKVVSGYGKMKVTGIAMHSAWVNQMTSTSEDNKTETLLQVHLNDVSILITKINHFIACLIFIILIVFYLTGQSTPLEGWAKFKTGTTTVWEAIDVVINIFIIAATIMVVDAPEGLLLAVTLTRIYSIWKMVANKALVRQQAALENMAFATVICVNITGTLTMNEMIIEKKAWIAGNVRESIEGLDANVVSLLHEGICQNINDNVFISESNEMEVTGSPKETAALSWGLKMGMDFTKVRAQSNALQVQTFDSKTKCSGVAVKPANNETVHIHWKGEAEKVVDVCNRWMTENGTAIEITEEKKRELLNIVEGMAASGLHCLAFAYRDIDESEMPPSASARDERWPESRLIPQNRLILLALMGMKDRLQPGVMDAVRLCQGAGVRVCMVTEDNLLRATAIATECGILREGDIPMEGSTFRNFINSEREKKNLPSISVMARCDPSEKVLMVKALKDMGEVVAVTEHGSSDVVSLHEANTGLPTGTQGFEAAKESFDIIILNDDFHSIANTICWGRFVYLNIQKFIELKLTLNMATFIINFITIMTSGAMLLMPVQLLWINMIMDMLGALALAAEPCTDELMKRAPIQRSKPLITCVMWCNLLGQSLFQAIIMLTFHFKGEDIFKLRDKPNSPVIKDTIIFTAFLLGQVFNETFVLCKVFNIFKGTSPNRMFMGIITIPLIMHVIIVEFLSKFASTHKLSWHLWLSCIGIGFLSWLIAFLLRLIPLPFDKDGTYCGYGNNKLRALEKEAHNNINNDSDDARVDIAEKKNIIMTL